MSLPAHSRRPGVDVGVVDLSKDLLARARKRGVGPSLHYWRGDMRRMPQDWTNRFDAVLNLFTSFGFFADPADDRRVLTGFADAGTYADTAPDGVKIVVRPSRYEPGRANIIVYNWAQQSTVSVDVSGILRVGDRYVVQNVQDFYGTPVAGGVYTGQPLQLPMVSVTPPIPLGATTAQAAPVTGPTFNVFVLMKTRRDRCVPGERGDREAGRPPP